MKRWWRRKSRRRTPAPVLDETSAANNSSGASGSNNDGADFGSGSAAVDSYRRSSSSSSSLPSTRATRTRRIFRAVRQGDRQRGYTVTAMNNDGSGEELEGLEGGLVLEMFLQSLLMRSEGGGGGRLRRNRSNVHLLGGIMEDIDNMSYERLLELFGDGSENKGADEWSIRALPSSVIQDIDTELSFNARQCMICLEDFENGDKRKTLPCLHGFHAGCCDKWLGINASCPICKHCIKV